MSEDKGRTNYVKVKDPAAFTAEMESLGLEVITDEKNGETLYGAMTADNDQGGWPTQNEQDEDIWIVEVLAKHLVAGEVCVVLSVGSTKMRSLWAAAWAFDATGKTVEISLSDIYGKAKETFGKAPGIAEY